MLYSDHTKFDNPALYKIADIDKLDYIITDTSPSQSWHQLAKEKHIKLMYPGYGLVVCHV